MIVGVGMLVELRSKSKTLDDVLFERDEGKEFRIYLYTEICSF